MADAASLFEFLELVGQLKHLPRTGWLRFNIEKPETVACHMYRMAMMTFLLDKDDPLDRKRCMEIALVHDLAESIVGDITPLCGVSKQEKHKREVQAMDRIRQLTGKSGEYLHALFMEYEDQSTPEAKFVRELDLYDMTMQAFEYEVREKLPGKLQEFLDSTRGKFSHPLVVKLINELYQRRDKFLSA